MAWLLVAITESTGMEVANLRKDLLLEVERKV